MPFYIKISLSKYTLAPSLDVEHLNTTGLSGAIIYW